MSKQSVGSVCSPDLSLLSFYNSKTDLKANEIHPKTIHIDTPCSITGRIPIDLTLAGQTPHPHRRRNALRAQLSAALLARFRAMQTGVLRSFLELVPIAEEKGEWLSA